MQSVCGGERREEMSKDERSRHCMSRLVSLNEIADLSRSHVSTHETGGVEKMGSLDLLATATLG